MSTEEKLLLLSWRRHLNEVAPNMPSRDIMVKYAIGWLRGAMAFASIETYSDAFLKIVLSTLWDIEIWEHYREH